MLPPPVSAPTLPTRNHIHGLLSVFQLGEDFTANLSGEPFSMAQDGIEIN
jgi:hypothetical protein